MKAFFANLAPRWPESDWLAEIAELAEARMSAHPHGDLPRWLEAVDRLPAVKPSACLDAPAPEFGSDTNDIGLLRELLMELHPWRKGPLQLGEQRIETEWRSDWKWDRVAPHVSLTGHRVLDIGCGNGYFGWRMLAQGARCVIGIDPTLVYVMQWLACRHFAGAQENYVLPLPLEEFPGDVHCFDIVFSMGVLYHRRDPVDHLKRLKSMLKTGGQLVLESLVLDSQEDLALVPKGRYARMRNVWAVPSMTRLNSWMRDAGLRDIRLLDMSRTRMEEQRSTRWMKFESLKECLDPDNPTLTVEGYPAPVRAALVAG